MSQTRVNLTLRTAASRLRVSCDQLPVLAECRHLDCTLTLYLSGKIQNHLLLSK
jgi:hypothetical protein